MAMFTTTFSILSFVVKKRASRIFCIGAAVLAGVGMMMSGTRGAMIIPFGGIVLYILLSKSLKAIATWSFIGILTFCFFYYTDIGEGNVFVRRMHTAKKRICFFQVRFLMLSILFSILFSDQGKECREVSSFSLRCTVGIQEIRVAAGAEVRQMNLLLRHSCCKKDLMIRLPEI